MHTYVSKYIADEISQQVCALKVLAITVGKEPDSLVYIYEEYNSVSSNSYLLFVIMQVYRYLCLCPVLISPLFQDVYTVVDAFEVIPIRNSPRVAAMVTEGRRQYFILMEQSVLCEAESLPLALLVAFSCYYVFNLEYPAKASGIFFFF